MLLWVINCQSICTKSDEVFDVIKEIDLDGLVIMQNLSRLSPDYTQLRKEKRLKTAYFQTIG